MNVIATELIVNEFDSKCLDDRAPSIHTVHEQTSVYLSTLLHFYVLTAILKFLHEQKYIRIYVCTEVKDNHEQYSYKREKLFLFSNFVLFGSLLNIEGSTKI